MSHFPNYRNSVKKYKCHINMEIVGSIYAPTYLYKYVHKGGDKAALTMVEHTGNSDEHPSQPHNEIKNFIDGRYVGPSEAV